MIFSEKLQILRKNRGFLAGKVDPLSLIIGLVVGAAIVVAGVVLVIKSKKS